jgi:hypothetical protein
MHSTSQIFIVLFTQSITLLVYFRSLCKISFNIIVYVDSVIDCALVILAVYHSRVVGLHTIKSILCTIPIYAYSPPVINFRGVIIIHLLQQ